jgi:GPI mannosyltransferase 3
LHLRTIAARAFATAKQLTVADFGSVFQLMRGCAPLPSTDQRVPWFALHMLVFAALLLRLYVGYSSEFLSHSDEVFQYLEQAHRLSFGYGFQPWEYRYGIRNWLLPGAIAAVLSALNSVGLDTPTIYVPVLKTIFALISVSLIYSAFFIARQLYSPTSGWVAAIFVAVWHEIVGHAARATPEVFSTYTLVGAFALALYRPSTGRALATGALIGLTFVLRIHYVVPAALIFGIILVGWRGRMAGTVALAGIAVCAFAGFLDLWTWGTPFISFWNAVLFNITYGVADTFGQENAVWYLWTLTFASRGLYALGFLYGMTGLKRHWPILLLIAAVILPHSLIAHKEYRFVFLVVPLSMILLADAITSTRVVVREDAFNWRFAASVAAIVVASAGLGYRNELINRSDRLVALLDLSGRSNVLGLIDLSGPWGGAGGFYYLHHNVHYYFEQYMADVSPSSYRQFATHIIAPNTTGPYPGFHISRKHGALHIQEQSVPPATVELIRDGRILFQPGVDDRIEPNVQPRY